MGLLQKLSKKSRSPNSSSSYFLTHNYEGVQGEHPDNDRRTKLEWIKNLHYHMNISVKPYREIWVWMDWFSIPHTDKVGAPLGLSEILTLLPLPNPHSHLSLYSFSPTGKPYSSTPQGGPLQSHPFDRKLYASLQPRDPSRTLREALPDSLQGE